VPIRRPAVTTRARSGAASRRDPAATARSTAIALLARRDYSAAELREKLLAREHAEDEVATTMDALVREGFVDDRKFAGAFVRTAIRVKGRGRLRIQHELEARGVDRAIITEALGAEATADEAEAIEKVLTKKRWPAQPSPIERRRMFEHLLRRGFPPDAVARALRNRRLEGDHEQ
jgi:regulatory protein